MSGPDGRALFTYAGVQKFRRWIRPGEQWNTDSGVIHEQVNGITCCGHQVGSEARGWELIRGRAEVTCKRCIKVITQRGQL